MKLRWNVASFWLKEFKNVYFNVTLVKTNRIIRVFDLIIILVAENLKDISYQGILIYHECDVK